MNREEAHRLQRQIAQTWPGTPLTHEAVDNLHVAIGHLSADEATAALAHWLSSSSNPPRPHDIRQAHEQITGTGPQRPEIAAPKIHLPPPRMAPDIAHAELAKMRAVLGEASPYSGRRP